MNKLTKLIKDEMKCYHRSGLCPIPKRTSYDLYVADNINQARVLVGMSRHKKKYGRKNQMMINK